MSPGETLSHAEIEAERLVDRYLLEQLDPAEKERFEHHLLDCSRCLDDLETTEQMLDGLRTATAEDAARVATGLGLLAGLARLGRIRQLVLLAALAAVFLLPLAVLLSRLASTGAELGEARMQLAKQRAPRAATVLALDLLRNDSSFGKDAPARQLRLGDPPEQIILDLALERSAAAESTHYRVVLRRADGKELWRVTDLVPSAHGDLTLSLDGTMLTAGDYAVEVAAQAATGATVEVGRFAFRVLEP